MALLELVKVAALAALVALVADMIVSDRAATTIGVALLYLLVVRITRPPTGIG